MRSLATLAIVAASLFALPAKASPFGSPMTLVFTDNLNLHLNHITTDNQASNELGVGLATDMFVSRNLSVGLAFHYDTDSTTDSVPGVASATSSFSSTSFTLRAGYADELTPLVYVWPLVGLAYQADNQTFANATQSSSRVIGVVTVPVIITPVPHLFIGIGPSYTTDLTTFDTVKSSDFGLDTVIGGWL